jgi:hypothetical protein
VASGAIYIDVEYNPEILGCPVSAARWISTPPAALHSVGETLAPHDEIAHVTAIAGPSTIMATVVVRNTAGLYAC